MVIKHHSVMWRQPDAFDFKIFWTKNTGRAQDEMRLSEVQTRFYRSFRLSKRASGLPHSPFLSYPWKKSLFGLFSNTLRARPVQPFLTSVRRNARNTGSRSRQWTDAFKSQRLSCSLLIKWRGPETEAVNNILKRMLDFIAMATSPAVP